MVKKSIGQAKMRAAMQRRLERGAAKMRRKRERQARKVAAATSD